MLVLITYDIKDTKKRTKVLTRVNKTCRKYLYQIQYSVFYGELNKPQYGRLVKELKKIIDQDIDLITILIAKNKNNVETIFIGPEPPIKVVI